MVVDRISDNDGLVAEIRSFAVYDYLKALLESGESKDGYIIPLNDFDNLQKLLTIDFTPRGFVPHKREFNAMLDSKINKQTKTKIRNK